MFVLKLNNFSIKAFLMDLFKTSSKLYLFSLHRSALDHSATAPTSHSYLSFSLQSSFLQNYETTLKFIYSRRGDKNIFKSFLAQVGRSPSELANILILFSGQPSNPEKLAPTNCEPPDAKYESWPG